MTTVHPLFYIDRVSETQLFGTVDELLKHFGGLKSELKYVLRAYAEQSGQSEHVVHLEGLFSRKLPQQIASSADAVQASLLRDSEARLYLLWADPVFWKLVSQNADKKARDHAAKRHLLDLPCKATLWKELAESPAKREQVFHLFTDERFRYRAVSDKHQVQIAIDLFKAYLENSTVNLRNLLSAPGLQDDTKKEITRAVDWLHQDLLANSETPKASKTVFPFGFRLPRGKGMRYDSVESAILRESFVQIVAANSEETEAELVKIYLEGKNEEIKDTSRKNLERIMSEAKDLREFRDGDDSVARHRMRDSNGRLTGKRPSRKSSK